MIISCLKKSYTYEKDIFLFKGHLKPLTFIARFLLFVCLFATINGFADSLPSSFRQTYYIIPMVVIAFWVFFANIVARFKDAGKSIIWTVGYLLVTIVIVPFVAVYTYTTFDLYPFKPPAHCVCDEYPCAVQLDCGQEKDVFQAILILFLFCTSIFAVCIWPSKKNTCHP